MVICFKFPFYKDFYFSQSFKECFSGGWLISVVSVVVVAGGGGEEGRVRIFCECFFLVTGTSGVWFVVKRFPNCSLFNFSALVDFKDSTFLSLEFFSVSIFLYCYVFFLLNYTNNLVKFKREKNYVKLSICVCLCGEEKRGKSKYF